MTRASRAPAERKTDPSRMMERVLGLPDQLRAAHELCLRGPELIPGARPGRVLVCGLGGSAIGGDFLRSFAATCCSAPVRVVRGYDLPAASDGEVFAFFVSYSGDTEETLSVWEQAARRGVARCAITSGGELGRRAERDGTPCLRIPPGLPPRAAVGWTSVPLFHALASAGMLPFAREDVEDAATACEEVIRTCGPEAPAGNPLRRWAEAAAGRLPVIYAPADPFGPAARRWATQMNENAKSLAHVALFPEQNHNEIVSWEVASDVHALAEVAFLTDVRVHPRVRRRMEIVAARVESAGGRVAWFEARGRGLVARLFSFTVMGDLASLYAANARGVDPAPVESIARLKEELGSLPGGSGGGAGAC